MMDPQEQALLEEADALQNEQPHNEQPQPLPYPQGSPVYWVVEEVPPD